MELDEDDVTFCAWKCFMATFECYRFNWQTYGTEMDMMVGGKMSISAAY